MIFRVPFGFAPAPPPPAACELQPRVHRDAQREMGQPGTRWCATELFSNRATPWHATTPEVKTPPLTIHPLAIHRWWRPLGNPPVVVQVFIPVPTGLPRELAESHTRATQPGLVSPGGSDQAQRYHPASLSSESGESLRHVGCYSVKQTVAW